MKRTPPQTSRGLSGSFKPDEKLNTAETLKKTPQSEFKTVTQGKKKKGKGKKQKKNSEEGSSGEESKKLEELKNVVDERLKNDLLLSSSESDNEDKNPPKIQEKQLKRGMSSDSDDDNTTKRVKNESNQRETSADDIEIDSQSDEGSSNQGDEPEAEPEVTQEASEDLDELEEEQVGKEMFLYLKCSDTDITLLSAYRVTEHISNVLHREAKITKINRCLRVSCSSREEQEKLKQMKYIIGHPLEVTEPFTKVNRKTYVSNRGIIFGVEEDITNDELSNALGVRAERILKRRAGAMTQTAQVILHFEGPIQEYVRLGWKRHRVSPYIPEPVRCFKCQRFGHIAANCAARKPRCPICAGQHPYEECEVKDHRTEKKAVCPNCKGPHPASYQGCPAFKQARLVRKIQSNEGISYAEAVRKHKAALNSPRNQAADVQTRPEVVTGNPQNTPDPQNINQPNTQATNVAAAPSGESTGNAINETKQIETICTGILDFLQKFTSALATNSPDDDLRTNLKQLAVNFSTCISALMHQLQHRSQKPQDTTTNHG